MNYTRLFADGWMMIWQSRLLLSLGFVSSIGSSTIGVARVWMSASLSGRAAQTAGLLSPLDLLSSFFDAPIPALRRWLVWGALALFLLFIGLWLISLLAEGAQIRTVIRLRDGQVATLDQALVAARRFMPRFIGIDTIIFLPLFLLTLFILLLILGILLGVLTQFISGSSANASFAVIALATICLLPLACLLLPVGFFTTVLRTLAFRESVLRDSGVRDSIRRTWIVAKSNVGRLFILILLVWGFRSSISLIVGLVTIPVMGVVSSAAPLATGDAAPTALGEIVEWAVRVGLIGMTILANGFAAALAATVWTLGYAEISGTREQ